MTKNKDERSCSKSGSWRQHFNGGVRKATICKCCLFMPSGTFSVDDLIDTGSWISGLTGFVVFLKQKSHFSELCYIYNKHILTEYNSWQQWVWLWQFYWSKKGIWSVQLIIPFFYQTWITTECEVKPMTGFIHICPCNREQFVCINGHNSDPLSITCGLPKGSILGPLLFLLYINDLPNTSKLLSFHLFADDRLIQSDLY